MKKLELKLVNITTKKYYVEVPERMKGRDLKESKISIEFLDGEYVFKTKFRDWFLNNRLTSEELRAIAEKLKELNKEDE